VQNVTLADGTVIRPLATHEERADAVRLEEETWGEAFTERVPAAILLVAERIGGVAAGAFSPAGRLLGFVFGLTGWRDGRLVHWSDILAVRQEAQGRRLGEALKRYQRERCRAVGVETMYWTFDPFVAKNAHLNLNRLGAAVAEFVPDMYGVVTNSPVHGGLGTDRFIVTWAVQGEPVPVPAEAALLGGHPCVGGPPGSCPPDDAMLPDAPHVVVRIPHEYEALVTGDQTFARAWRRAARRAFLHYFALDYRVTAFVPGRADDAAYLLSRAG
jgi:predicted GNAT superfamily acetyltransferase